MWRLEISWQSKLDDYICRGLGVCFQWGLSITAVPHQTCLVTSLNQITCPWQTVHTPPALLIPSTESSVSMIYVLVTFILIFSWDYHQMYELYKSVYIHCTVHLWVGCTPYTCTSSCYSELNHLWLNSTWLRHASYLVAQRAGEANINKFIFW